MRSWSLMIVLLGLCLGPVAAQTRQATVSGRGNIRFGPSTQAPVVTTLEDGTTVEVIGPVAGKDGWYEIRFPPQGGAWVHGRNLAQTEDPRALRVTQDGVRVRDDARLRSNLVTQLDAGDIVTWKGRMVDGQWAGITHGGWYKVHPPGAVAYAHRIVLDFGREAPPQVAAREADDDAGTVAGAGGSRQLSPIERTWRNARTLYERYRTAVDADPQRALELDWQGLVDRLDRVVEDHGSFRTRLLADSLRKRVGKIAWLARKHQSERGIEPKRDIPELTGSADEPEPVDEPALAAVEDLPQRVPEEPRERQQPPPAQPQPQREPQQPEPKPEPVREPPVAVTPEPEPPRVEPEEPTVVAEEEAVPALPSLEEDSYRAIGWLEPRDVPGTSANYVIIDSTNEIEALVKVADGAGIQLAEYHWRRVGVKGEVEKVTIERGGQASEAALVHITAIDLVNR